MIAVDKLRLRSLRSLRRPGGDPGRGGEGFGWSRSLGDKVLLARKEYINYIIF
jgi:hypothetical protein